MNTATNPTIIVDELCGGAKPTVGDRVLGYLVAALAWLGNLIANLVAFGGGQVMKAIVFVGGLLGGLLIAALAAVLEVIRGAKWFVTAAVVVMAFLFLWNAGSKDLGSRPPEVGWFGGLIGQKAGTTIPGVKGYQAINGDVYVGVPYVGWSKVGNTKDLGK